MTNQPICTVLLITYNHAPYVAKSIESVLSQKTQYPFVIKIFDDASTDGSSDIIREYVVKYPEKIQAFIAEKNMGAQANIWRAYQSVDTKYCCPMETDDYWCNDNKLEMQITALETHPECSFAAGQSKIVLIEDQTGIFSSTDKYVADTWFKHKAILSFQEIEKVQYGFFPHTSSRCLNMSMIDLPKLCHVENLLFDAEQFFLFLSKGSMYYFYEDLSVYQRTGKGAASGKANCESLQQLAEHLLRINADTNYIFWKKIWSYLIVLASWRIKIDEVSNCAVVPFAPISWFRLSILGVPLFKVRTKGNAKRYYLMGVNFMRCKVKEHSVAWKIFGVPVMKISKKQG